MRRWRQLHAQGKGGEKKFGVSAVYSAESPFYPASDGTVCARRETSDGGEALRLNCDTGFGTATFVTGTFGFAAAAHVVNQIAQKIWIPNKRKKFSSI